MVQISLAHSVIWAAVAGAVFLSNVATHSCSAFQPLSRLTRASHESIMLRASFNDDVPSNEGQELADEFYAQLKRRENPQSDNDDDNNTSLPVSLPSQQPNSQNPDDFTIDTNSPPSPTRKFTGASPSLFSESTSSSSSNLEREQEREFNLVGNFERTLGIQAAILFASIVFVASVGLSGGISDGSDRYFGGMDEIDDTVIEYSRTDDAGQVKLDQSVQESIWL